MSVINQTVRMFDRVSMVKDGSPDWGRGGGGFAGRTRKGRPNRECRINRQAGRLAAKSLADKDLNTHPDWCNKDGMFADPSFRPPTD